MGRQEIARTRLRLSNRNDLLRRLPAGGGLTTIPQGAPQSPRMWEFSKRQLELLGHGRILQFHIRLIEVIQAGSDAT